MEYPNGTNIGRMKSRKHHIYDYIITKWNEQENYLVSKTNSLFDQAF